jgi:hypothetical protein
MAAGPVVYLRQRRPWVPGEGRPLLQHQDCRATEDAAQQCNQDPSSRARRSRGDGIHVGRDARFRAGCWLRPPAEQHRPQRELFYPEPGSRLRADQPGQQRGSSHYMHGHLCLVDGRLSHQFRPVRRLGDRRVLLPGGIPAVQGHEREKLPCDLGLRDSNAGRSCLGTHFSRFPD